VSTNADMDINKRRQWHRSWPESLKREIVAATLTPGSSVSVVARRDEVNANQGFAWRRRYRDGSMQPAGLQLMPVRVMPEQPVAAAPAGANELVEIVLPGYRVRVGDGIKASTLRLVLDVLERR
jgi:transposase